MATATEKLMTLRPLDDRVVIKALEAEATTAGGIVLPDCAKDKPQRGSVIAIGDGKLLDDGTRGELQVSVGDQVIFSSYAGTEIKVGGEELLIVREDEILAVLS